MLISFKQAQKGVSLIELMVGITVGLLILAGVSNLFADYIRSNKDLLTMTRLNQELRSATDLMARDIRRAGYWQNAITGVWYSGSASVVANPYATVDTTTGIAYDYALDADDSVGTAEAFGFKLDNGTLMMLKDNGWAAVTDSSSTTITSFTITPTLRTISLLEYCIKPCPGGSTTCPPQMTVRDIDISITGQSKNDSTITRQIRESVRVRNDQVTGACPL